MNSVMIENRRLEIEQFHKAATWQAHLDRRFNDSTKFVPPNVNNKNSIFAAYREHEKEQSRRLANSGRIRPGEEPITPGGGLEDTSDGIDYQPVNMVMLSATMNGGEQGSERTLAYFDHPVSSTRSTAITLSDQSPNGHDSEERLLDTSSERPIVKKPLPPIIRTTLTKNGLGMTNAKVAVISVTHPLEMSTQLSIQSSTSSQITETVALIDTKVTTTTNEEVEGGT
jgi:hypothetical protein